MKKRLKWLFVLSVPILLMSFTSCAGKSPVSGPKIEIPPTAYRCDEIELEGCFQYHEVDLTRFPAEFLPELKKMAQDLNRCESLRRELIILIDGSRFD
jgi:hypothetical protein